MDSEREPSFTQGSLSRYDPYCDLELGSGAGNGFSGGGGNRPRGLSAIRTDIEFDDQFCLSGSFEEAEEERLAALGLLERTGIHSYTNQFIDGPPKLEKRFRRVRLKENARLLRWVSGVLLLCFLLDCATQVYRWQADRARVAVYTLLCVALCFQLALFLFRNRLYSHLLIHYYQYTTTLLGVSAFLYVLVTDTMSSCILFGCSLPEGGGAGAGADGGADADGTATVLLHSEDATRAAYGMSLLFAVLPFGFRVSFAYCAVMYLCALLTHVLLRTLTLLALGGSAAAAAAAQGGAVVVSTASGAGSFELLDSLLLDTLYVLTIMCVMLYGAYVYERNDREMFLRMEMQKLQKDQLQSELELMREELGFAEDEANTNELKLEIERAKSDLDRLAPGAQLELEDWVMPFDALVIDQRIGEGSCGEVYRGRVRASREHLGGGLSMQGYLGELASQQSTPAAATGGMTALSGIASGRHSLAKSFRSTFSFHRDTTTHQVPATPTTTTPRAKPNDDNTSSPFNSNGSSCVSPLYMSGSTAAGARGSSSQNNHAGKGGGGGGPGHRREYSTIPYNSVVAVKRIAKHKITRKVVLSLLQETLTMSRCRHPNVLRLIGLVYDPFVCVVFEYMALGALKDILEASSPAAVARSNGSFGVRIGQHNNVSAIRSSKHMSLSGKFSVANAGSTSSAAAAAAAAASNPAAPELGAPDAAGTLNSSCMTAGNGGLPQQEDWFKDQDRKVQRNEMLRALVDLTNPAQSAWTHAKTRMCVNVAAGVSYLHSQGIIHRDLKADNLMVDGTHAVKVADMGTARVLAEFGGGMLTEAEVAEQERQAAAATDAAAAAKAAAKAANRKVGSWRGLGGARGSGSASSIGSGKKADKSRAGKPPLERGKSRLVRRPLSRVGSPLWIAPEVISSEGRYDEKCDVWSFGVVMCEIITHRDPYSDETGRCHFNLLSVVDGELNPVDFVQDCAATTPASVLHLARDCCTFDARKRPSMKQVLFRLLQITVEQESSKVEADAIKAAGPYLRYSQPSRRSVFRRHGSSVRYDSEDEGDVFNRSLKQQQQQQQQQQQKQSQSLQHQSPPAPAQEEEEEEQQQEHLRLQLQQHPRQLSIQGLAEADLALGLEGQEAAHLDLEDGHGYALSDPLGSEEAGASHAEGDTAPTDSDLDSLGDSDEDAQEEQALDNDHGCPMDDNHALLEAPPRLLGDHDAQAARTAYKSARRRASGQYSQRGPLRDSLRGSLRGSQGGATSSSRGRPVSVRTEATYLTAFSQNSGETFSPHGSQWESGLTVGSTASPVEDISSGGGGRGQSNSRARRGDAKPAQSGPPMLHRAYSTHALGETVNSDAAQSLLSSHPSMGSMLNVKDSFFCGVIKHLKDNYDSKQHNCASGQTSSKRNFAKPPVKPTAAKRHAPDGGKAHCQNDQEAAQFGAPLSAETRKLSASELITKTIAKVRSGTAQTFGSSSKALHHVGLDELQDAAEQSSKQLNVSFISKGNF